MECVVAKKIARDVVSLDKRDIADRLSDYKVK